MTLNIELLRPGYADGTAISHVCMALSETMPDANTRARYWVVTSDPRTRSSSMERAIAPALRRVVYRSAALENAATQYLYWRYLHGLGPGDIAYLWPGTSLAVFEAAKRRGATIVMEMINCFQAHSKRILDDEYGRLGWAASHTIRESDIAVERAAIAMADHVFAPSPAVRDSLRSENLQPGKILSASYGWSPQRFVNKTPLRPRGEGLTALFVGRLCVRKGTHLLLDHWAHSGVHGRLLLDGQIDADIRSYCAANLTRADVTHLGFSPDVGRTYASADVMVFPTLEEGSPLVSYEALGCGLPMIASPMGAGEIVRHGIEGFVLDPYDTDAWGAALRQLADDPGLRARMSQAARDRAAEYTWIRVGARRRNMLHQVARNRAP